jgi:hypothetical protein
MRLWPFGGTVTAAATYLAVSQAFYHRSKHIANISCRETVNLIFILSAQKKFLNIYAATRYNKGVGANCVRPERGDNLRANAVRPYKRIQENSESGQAAGFMIE